MSTPGQYPEDEFDIAARDRTPQGVHRQVRSPLATLLPYLAVIVLVPLLAWGAVAWLGSDRTSTPGDDQATETPAEEVTDDGSDEPGEEPTEDETATEEEPTDEEPTDDDPLSDPDVVFTTSISVLNGSGVAGVAAEGQASLADAGFSSVFAGDYTASSPEVTTLYYRNAALLPTAEAVGDVLGITNLVEAPGATQNSEIAIVIRPDSL